MGYFGEDEDVQFEGAVFPKDGTSEQDVMAQLDAFSGMDADEVPGHVMLYGLSLMEHLPASRVVKAAYMKYVKKNMVVRELMPGATAIQQQLRRMVAEALGFGDEARVRITSGGSESLYCAINAAYQWARKTRPDVTQPEVVAPYSIHAAFTKWCHYTGIKLKRIPLGEDYRADIGAMEKAITPNTIMIAGSAPCWPYGLYDDIEALSALAEQHGIWMHSDGCLGGFLAPFVEKLGVKLPTWDFRVPGVRSVSADLHKYGYACKPCSSITFRNKEWEQYHTFTVTDWPSGPYATEALLGSTTAGSFAGAWAIMKFLGEEGYVSLAKRSMEVKKRYTDGINAIDGLDCWDTDLTPIVFGTEGLDLFAVMGGLFERQLFCLPVIQPPLIQIIVDPVTDEVVDRFLSALAEVVQDVKDGKTTIEKLAAYM